MFLNGIQMFNNSFAGFKFLSYRIKTFLYHGQSILIHQLFDIRMQRQVVFIHFHGG